MSGISQTIPSYTGGISEQPDYIKAPGTVKDAVNVIPDLTYGLFKRLGAKRLVASALNPSAENCKWFHFYKNANHGVYVGQIDKDGAVKMWRTKTWTDSAGTTYQAGAEVPVTYNILAWNNSEKKNEYTASGAETVIKNYLKSFSDPDANEHDIHRQEDRLQTLTINDTTFVLNRVVPPLLKGSMKGHTDWWNDSISVSDPYTTTEEPVVAKKGPAASHTYYAYVELKKTENGRQYALDIGGSGKMLDNSTVVTDTERQYSTATRINISHAGYPKSFVGGSGDQGHCPHVGTRVWSNQWKHSGTYTENNANETDTHSGGASIKGAGNNNWKLTGRDAKILNHEIKKYGLCFRFTVTGQQGVVSGGTDIQVDDRGDYTCTYTMKSDLLHGGIGWEKGDTCGAIHPLTFADSSATDPNNASEFNSRDGIYGGHYGDIRLKGADYIVNINEHETYKANVIGPDIPAINGFIRPYPTAFDAETAASPSAILAGIQKEVLAMKHTSGGDAYFVNSDGTGDSGCQIVGNGLYFYHKTLDFNVKVLESDLMRVMTKHCNDVSELPNQCKHDYVVTVSNSQNSQEDDYHLIFVGNGGKDGAGTWNECPYPGIKTVIDPKTMPVQIQLTSNNSFVVKQVQWTDRGSGDNITNPRPAFISTAVENSTVADRNYKYITKMLYFRNRLCILNGSWISLSAPNDLTNFWRETATVVGAADAIDISTSKNTPGNLNNGLEINAGLLLFSQNEQFLLGSEEATVLNPDTAKISHLSTYFNNSFVEPMFLGTTVGFLDNSGSYTRFMEMAVVQSGTEPIVVDNSKVVPRLLPNDLDLFGVSRDNNIIFVGKRGTDTVYGYRWFQVGEQRLLSSWFKWKFPKSIKHFFVSDDSFFFIDDNNFFQRVNFSETTDEITVNQDGTDWYFRVDNWTSITGGSFSSATNKTTFTGVSWLSSVTGVSAQLVLIKNNGQFVNATVDGTTVTVDGDFTTGDRYLGYLYDMQVDFPTFYPTKNVGNKNVSDVNSSLVLHRIKLALGRVGSYSSTLNRVGKDAYIDTYEQTMADDYEASDLPYELEEIRTIPVYEKNTNIDLTVKSTSPSPATIRSLSWEGDYTTKNYQRV